MNFPQIDSLKKFESMMSEKLGEWNEGMINKWCQTFGSKHFHEWDLYLALQLLDKETQIIVKTSMKEFPKTRYFVVSLDLFNKALVLGELPRHF